MLQIAPIVLLSEIVPGRGHRLCKSSQLQRALRRVIYGWQRISKVKISRIFVLLQMISVSRVLNELISDFDELLDQVKLYQSLHFMSSEIKSQRCYHFDNNNLDPKSEFRNVEKIKTIGATFMAASGLNPFIRYPAIMTSSQLITNVII